MSHTSQNAVFWIYVDVPLTLSDIFNVSLKIRVTLEVKISMYSGIHRAVVKAHIGQVTSCILHFTFACVK